MYRFLILCLAITHFSFAQNHKEDSLLLDLKSYKERDTIKIQKLLNVSEYYFLNDIEKSKDYIQLGLNIARDLGDYKKISLLKTKLAQTYVTQGLFTEALSEILDAVNILDTIQISPRDKMSTLNILSTVYRGYGDNQKSLDVILDVIKFSENYPLTKEVARYHYNAGNSFAQLGDRESAEKYFLKAQAIAKKVNDKRFEIIMTSVLGDHYKNLGKYELAKTYIKNSIDYYAANNEERNLGSSYRILGDIESLQNNHLDAIPLYEQAIVIFNRTNNLYYAKETNQRLFISYSVINENKKAEEAYARFKTLTDSLDSKDRKRLIAEMNTKFDTEKIKREKEIAQLNSSKNKSLFIAASVIATLILLTSVFYVGRVRANKKAELITLELKETQKRLALEKQYRQSELKALKAQMDPHFIFNALNSIQEYIVMNQKDLASDYLGKFADLMRKYLHNSGKGAISLLEEVSCLNIYLELEQVRFEETLTYTIEVDSDIALEEVFIPTMIIQPYVENAIKHGLLHKKKDRKLIVNITKEERDVICVIQDNGIGRARSAEIKSKRMQTHQSFATKANESRLALLNYGKDRKIGIDVIDLFDNQNKPIGTKVVLRIPYNKA